MIEGCHRFLGRVWRLATGGVERVTLVDREPTAADVEVEKATHRLIDRVSRDFERWSYNTAVAAAMEFVNTVYRHVQAPEGARRADRRLRRRHLAPVARAHGPPHHRRAVGAPPRPDDASVHDQSWPVADPALVRVDRVTMVVQVNGKVRDRLEVDAGYQRGRRPPLWRSPPPRWSRPWPAASPRKVIARPPRLVNVVL